MVYLLYYNLYLIYINKFYKKVQVIILISLTRLLIYGSKSRFLKVCYPNLLKTMAAALLANPLRVTTQNTTHNIDEYTTGSPIQPLFDTRLRASPERFSTKKYETYNFVKIYYYLFRIGHH